MMGNDRFRTEDQPCRQAVSRADPGTVSDERAELFQFSRNLAPLHQRHHGPFINVPIDGHHARPDIHLFAEYAVAHEGEPAHPRAVEQFEIAIPTLDEIFIRTVSDGATSQGGASCQKRG